MLEKLLKIKEYGNSITEFVEKVRRGVPTAVFGVPDPFKIFMASALDRPVLYVVKDGLSAELAKKEAEVIIGDIKSVVKFNEIYNSEKEVKPVENKIKVARKSGYGTGETRLNVIGKTSLEAVDEVKNFIDSAVVNNLDEILNDEFK